MVRTERRTDLPAIDPAFPAIAHAPSRGTTDTGDIPDVQEIIRAHADPIERNEAFNVAYQQLALGIQQTIGRAPGTLPNWFAVGAYASPQVGRSMIAAHQTLRAVQLLQEQPHGISRDQIFDDIGLTGSTRSLAQMIARVLDVPGCSHGATAIACFVAISIATDRATAKRALLDPRLAIAVAWRLNETLRPEGSRIGNAFSNLRSFLGIDTTARDQALDNMARFCRTYETLLAEGNRAIFSDIGGSAAAFLRLSQGRDLYPDEVLSELRLPHSSEKGSTDLYWYGMQHASDRPPPTDFSQIADPATGNDLVRAAFALYALAGHTRDLDRKNELVSFANNMIAWREQFDIVQPVFVGKRPGELDRSRVLSALTPLVQVPFNGFTWTFASFAQRQPSRDGSVLTAHASEYDWSKFADRWPAILDAFDLAYARADEVFRFKSPRVTL